MAVYLDWNATAPPLAEAVEAMAACAREAWGNPASVHSHGRLARSRVEDARQAVADLAGVDPRDVVLTSGGTEANNLALRSALAGHGDSRWTLITSRVEHPSVVRVAEAIGRESRAGEAAVYFVAVREDGRVDLADLQRACDEADANVLLALQAVNHETGVIQPVEEAIAIARARKRGESSETLVHVDAVQAFGRLAEAAAGADTRSLAGHKIRGPKGIGALVARPGLRLAPLLLGGAQERGLRPGTVDPVAASGLAVAARHAKSSPARYAALAPLRDSLERALLASSPARAKTALRPRARRTSPTCRSTDGAGRSSWRRSTSKG